MVTSLLTAGRDLDVEALEILLTKIDQCLVHVLNARGIPFEDLSVYARGKIPQRQRSFTLSF
jgi:hypothetical protein